MELENTKKYIETLYKLSDVIFVFLFIVFYKFYTVFLNYFEKLLGLAFVIIIYFLLTFSN